MKPLKFKSISEFHYWRELPKPAHPLLSVVNYADVRFLPSDDHCLNLMFDFYSIALKRNSHGKLLYGQENYDFDEGVMFFTAPGQLLRITEDQRSERQASGWILFIHPDFLYNTLLALKMRNYEYFDYAINEALFLSDKEEVIINGIMENIRQEYNSNIDNFSQDIMISQLETLLNYAERFYHRQFLTRKKEAHVLLDRLEKLLNDSFNDEQLLSQGVPSVEFVAHSLNLSASYLRGLLKALTGKNTQQHIHEKLIEKAKERLSTTNQTVSEIAYQLGFEHPQSFNKLFKLKTSYTPAEFKKSFN